MLNASLLMSVLMAQSGQDSSVRLPSATRLVIRAETEAVEVRVAGGDAVRWRGGESDRSQFDKPTSILTLHAATAATRGKSVTPLIVTVPASASVQVITTGGNVTFAGSPADVSVQSTSGNIRFDDAVGRATLSTLTGAVTVSRYQGKHLSIDAPGGNIGIYTAFIGSIEAKSIKGSISLRALLATSVKASTVKGSVQIDGPFHSDGVYTLESHEGAVTVFGGDGFDAVVTATLFTGEFVDDYNKPVAAETMMRSATNRAAGGGRGGGAGITGAATSATADRSKSLAANAAPAPVTSVSKTREVTFGSGETHFILNTFGGVISVRRAGGL